MPHSGLWHPPYLQTTTTTMTPAKYLLPEQPPPSVKIMRLYARMSYEKRLMLLTAAEVISRESIAFEDTLPSGSLETNFSRFDSKS